MADTKTEDKSNKSLSTPVIRTMEEDLRLLKANPSGHKAGAVIMPTVVVPEPKRDDGIKKTPINLASLSQVGQSSAQSQQNDTDKEKIKKEQDALVLAEAEKELEKIQKKEEQLKREKDRLAEIDAEKELEKIRKKDEEARIEREKTEQANKAIEDATKAKKAKEKAERERIRKEKERLAAIEAAKEAERQRKRDEELRIQREKEEQAKREIEEAERLRKEKMKAERERIRKEKERLAAIEAAKEAERQRKRDEELRIQREKEEQVRLEKEKIEQAKREEAMKIRKKLADEIKKEMQEDILKEREKAEQVKIQMELEIKKEIEAAEEVKRQREAAMRKRVAKVIKEEMDEEIEKEKEKAEEIKKEVEVEIKKEMEEDLEKEEELEKEVMAEMATDMRKEIAEQIKKDKENADNKNITSQIRKEAGIAMSTKAEANPAPAMANPSLKAVEPVVKIVEVPANLPIGGMPVSDNPVLAKTQAEDEEKKIARLLKEEELEIIKKKDEELRKEKEIAEQFKREKENLERIVREKEAAERDRIQKEKEMILQAEAMKAAEIKKEPIAAAEPAAKDKNIFAYKNAWKDSPLSSEFFASEPKTAKAPAPVTVPLSSPKRSSSPVSNSPSDFASAVSSGTRAASRMPEEPTLPSFAPAEPGLEKSAPPATSDFDPAEPELGSRATPAAPSFKPAKTILETATKPPVVFSPKKKLSTFPAENTFGPKPGGRKTAKNQYFELSSEYEHLSPEMRLAQQGFSSLSADLEEGVRKDAELLDQDIALKKKVAGSSAIAALPASQRAAQSKLMQVPAEGSLGMRSSATMSPSILMAILKIGAIVLLIAGIFYGTYYFVFKGNNASNNSQTGQPVLASMKQFDISLDFNSNAMPAIKDFVKNNPDSTENVSRIMIKNTADGNTLKISEFGKVLGVIIPAKFLDNLTEDYDLVVFNYPKNNYLRMGMVLKVKDAALAESLAKEWEPAMFIGTNSFLFDASGYYNNSKVFDLSNYKSETVNYLSLGKNNLALNYVVDKNKSIFLFATSQEDIYYLIDQLGQ